MDCCYKNKSQSGRKEERKEGFKKRICRFDWIESSKHSSQGGSVSNRAGPEYPIVTVGSESESSVPPVGTMLNAFDSLIHAPPHSVGRYKPNRIFNRYGGIQIQISGTPFWVPDGCEPIVKFGSLHSVRPSPSIGRYEPNQISDRYCGI